MHDRGGQGLMRQASTHPAGTVPLNGARYGVDAENLLEDVNHGLAVDNPPARPSGVEWIAEFATAHHRQVAFLALLAHELRSPLASIRHAAYLLGSPVGETFLGRHRAQALIERQVRCMTRLVDDLLDVSRVSLGRLRLQCERIDLRLIVGRAIETLESDIRERHHRLSIALPDAPVWLHGDPGRLEQVFVNLLANASKYTNTAGELTVGMYSQDRQAIVRVRDSGIGVVPEELPHVFDLFKQAEAAASRPAARAEGLGIGLALVRNLVELHGGTVTAHSAGLGQGSEFTVRLPIES